MIASAIETLFTVFIIDDDGGSRYTHSEALSKRGFKPRVFRSAGEVEKWLDEHPEEKSDVSIVDGLHGDWQGAIQALIPRSEQIYLISGNREFRQRAKQLFPQISTASKEGLSTDSPIYNDIEDLVRRRKSK